MFRVVELGLPTLILGIFRQLKNLIAMLSEKETAKRPPFHVIVGTQRSGSSLCGHLLAEAGWIRYGGETHCPLNCEQSVAKSQAMIQEYCAIHAAPEAMKAPLCDKAVAPWTLPDHGRYLAERADSIYLLLRHPLAIWRSMKQKAGPHCTLKKLSARLNTLRRLVELSSPEKLKVLTYYELTSEKERERLFGKPLNSYITTPRTGEPGWGDPSKLIRTGKIRSLSLKEDLARALPEVWMDLENEDLTRAMAEFRAILELTQLESLDISMPEEVLSRCRGLQIVDDKKLTPELFKKSADKQMLVLTVSDCKRKGELPCEDQVFNRICSEDLAHRCSPEELLKILKELRRILEPEGVLRLSTINLEWSLGFSRELTSEVEGWYLEQIPKSEKRFPLDAATLIGNYLQRSQGHQYLFLPPSLKGLMGQAGFEKIGEVEVGEYESHNDYPAGLYAKERFILEARSGQNRIDYDNDYFEATQLVALVESLKEENTITLTFGNSAYTQVIDNWVAHMKLLAISSYVVIALDQRLADHLSEQDIPHFLVSCESGFQGFWKLRMRLVSTILAEDVGVIFSDADAVWSRDPRSDLLNDTQADLLISQGTVFPPKAFEMWGFVLCCGFFYVAPTPQARELFDSLENKSRREKFDDQRELNLEILRRGVTWKISDPEVVKLANGRELLGSRDRMVGILEDLRVEVLPFTLYQRPVIDTGRGYVFHPGSPGDKRGLQGSIRGLTEYGLWLPESESNPKFEKSSKSNSQTSVEESKLSSPILRVLDVGARGGVKHVFPHWMVKRSISDYLKFFQFTGIEPDVRANLDKKQYTSVHSLALAGSSGKRKFYKTRKPSLSSILEPDLEALRHLLTSGNSRGYEVVKELEIDTLSIDDFCQRESVSYDWLKIDVQGAEYEIIQGARKTIENVSVVIVEASSVSQYRNQKTTPEVIAIMNEYGFNLAMVNYKPQLPSENDLVFVKKIGNIKNLRELYSLFLLFSIYHMDKANDYLLASMAPKILSPQEQFILREITNKLR